MHIHKFIVIMFTLGVMIGLSACALVAIPTPALTPITVQLAWTHQAQFAGFYAADQNGDYAAEGLSVTFLEGGPNVDLLTPVLSGSAWLGDTNADALILACAGGKPLRAIATIYRRSNKPRIALPD